MKQKKEDFHVSNKLIGTLIQNNRSAKAFGPLQTFLTKL